ncbi:MAG TPA: metallophosphoesterase, partial [Fimbriimonadaceae bacterium]|nr:metallophosphoesterase [Fimbriimonadaceae bacterium]
MSPQWTDRQRRLEEAIKGGETLSPGIWRTLQQDEQVLILLMADPTKVTPTTPGNVEFGWVLYYLNNKAWTWLKDALRDLGMPASKITHAMWQAWWTIWESKGVVMGDGSWLDTAKYAVLDLGVETGGTGLGWAEAAIDYFLIQLNIITLANFAHTPAVITIDPNTHPTLKIAMMGDWGTGSYKDGNLSNSPSQLVAAQIANQNPDIVVHLGDVYYSGTATEEQNNLLNCWPKGTLGNFTLNSNHEMYDGGNAYYSTVLTHSLFSAQNGTSYFAINYGDWV